MLMALPAEIAGTTMPEKWSFTVDPKMIDKVKTALNSGKRVKLTYRQWFIAPLSIDTEYIIIDVQDGDTNRQGV